MLIHLFPDLKRVFVTVIQHERQLNNQHSISSLEPQVIYAKNDSRRIFPYNKKPTCSYCGGTNHVEARCYKKHGFPHDHSNRNRTIENNPGNKGFVNKMFKIIKIDSK